MPRDPRLDAFDDAWGEVHDFARGEVKPFPVDTLTSILNAPPRENLVKGFVGRGEMALFYGPPKRGKTFAAMHFGICVATGAAWFGRRCKAPLGFVLYCGLEGGSGFRARLMAILQHDPVLGQQITDENLIIIRERMDLRTSTDQQRLIMTIAKHEAKIGLPCLMVVVDTVARALGSGNDTSPEDMAAFIVGADIIRQANSKPAIALIHHCGKDKGRGPRGRSDLAGALDTCVLVDWREENSANAGNRLTCEFAKDDPDGWAVDFRLEQVVVDHDEDGDEITTCVLREDTVYDVAPVPKAKAKKAEAPWGGARQRIFVRELRKLAKRHPDGVARSLLRSAFLLELNADRQSDGDQPLTVAAGKAAFRQVLHNMRERDPPLFVEEEDGSLRLNLAEALL
jgi:hypothetical protein